MRKVVKKKTGGTLIVEKYLPRQNKLTLAPGRRLRERLAFIEKALAGRTDYPLTNEELEARSPAI
jgi:hypothetical protein